MSAKSEDFAGWAALARESARLLTRIAETGHTQESLEALSKEQRGKYFSRGDLVEHLSGAVWSSLALIQHTIELARIAGVTYNGLLPDSKEEQAKRSL